ncbi:MAG: DnaJ C-terminal domain-containing protein, partial [Verrucomicrobiota bacterium]
AEAGAKKVRCATCKGHGQVVRSQGFFQMRRTCPTCHGQRETIDRPCRACSGEGRTEAEASVHVRIPPGVDTGVKLRLTGNGSAGRRGAAAGDLYVVVHVADHELFERDGDDLACAKCSGSGAEAGAKKVRCATCKGHGQVVRSQGFFQMRQTCPTCHGQRETIDRPCRACSGEGRTVAEASVHVRIPPGVDTGVKLRSTGNGSAGRRGAAAGDLYVVVHVADHELFERDGDDLACAVPVKFSVAALGGQIHVPKLKGKALLKVPAGTQGGTVFRLRGEGMPRLRGSGAGDLLVRVDVDVPKKLTEAQRKSLQAYADACGDDVAPVSESWAQKFRRFFD